MMNREQIKARLAHPSLWNHWVTVARVYEDGQEVQFPVKGGPGSGVEIDKRDHTGEGRYELR